VRTDADLEAGLKQTPHAPDVGDYELTPAEAERARARNAALAARDPGLRHALEQAERGL